MAKGKYQQWIEPEGLAQLGRWARDGLTDKQIAEKKIGVSERTFTEWKTRFSSVSAVLKRGKEVADGEVEDALFKAAIGYEYKEVTRERRFNRKTGEEELVITKEVTKYMAPNVTAMIFWLKNRKPDVWTDRREETAADNVSGDAVRMWVEKLKAMRGS